MLAYIRAVGGGLYVVQPVEAVDPGFGQGIGVGGPDPGYGHPIFGPRPDQGLPGGGHISNRPPMNPNFPDNSLPSGPPPHVAPGATLVLVRDQGGVWHYAVIPPGQPAPPPLPDQGLPGGVPPHVSNVVPGQPVIGGGPAPTPPPHIGGGPMPPQVNPLQR